MIKSDNDTKLNSLEEVIKYMKDADAWLMRNVESEPRNWIENYSKMKRGKPEKIDISEDLFMDCFNSEYFREDAEMSSKNEFSYLYIGLAEEDS